MDNNNIIITIGRQIGSGGSAIAKMLAEEFGARLYDKEILNLAARESGFCEEFFEENDEKKGFFKTALQFHFPLFTRNSYYNTDFNQENLYLFQCDAIRKAASEGSCVFVGRTADYVLRDMDNVVNVFVSADLDTRIAEIARRRSCRRRRGRRGAWPQTGLPVRWCLCRRRARSRRSRRDRSRTCRPSIRGYR